MDTNHQPSIVVDDVISNAAREIVLEAAPKLRELGLHCSIGQLTLPQGCTLNLHIGETTTAAAAAYVAMGHGGYIAGRVSTATGFATEVAHVIATDVIERAARV